VPSDPLRERARKPDPSSLRCGFVFVDEAAEQVSAPNVFEVAVGLWPWRRFYDGRSLV
jgi:hypothetical protein